MASYSIVDVAKKAGVSKSTVSRVLTGGSVSEKTIQAVRRAMEELDYVPNRNAQGLRGAPAYTIGVAVSDPDALLRRSLTTRLAGMNHVFSQMGYSFLLINGNPAKQDSMKMSNSETPFFVTDKLCIPVNESTHTKDFVFIWATITIAEICTCTL